MAAEHGDAARRGFWASWPQAGVPAGNLLAAAMLAIMAALQAEEDFLDWGWRVPFILSALLVVVGWYIRNRVAESPMFEAEFDAAEAPARVPAIEVLRERPKALVLGRASVSARTFPITSSPYSR
ncbi:MFS transporter [Sphingomonas sediminicola]|uniref:MFS transporter n=1 Tax=Sphingomonas sediminicola TaxID=386874 RepID=UPI0024833879|nr:MFS transporter [Sphingomonas sediminicola]